MCIRDRLDTAQIGGVDSTVRKTEVSMEADAKLFVMEKLMTHDNQTAVSDMTVEMNGAGSSAQIVSRSVAKGHSVPVSYTHLTLPTINSVQIPGVPVSIKKKIIKKSESGEEKGTGVNDKQIDVLKIRKIIKKRQVKETED